MQLDNILSLKGNPTTHAVGECCIGCYTYYRRVGARRCRLLKCCRSSCMQLPGDASQPRRRPLSAFLWCRCFNIVPRLSHISLIFACIFSFLPWTIDQLVRP